MDKISGSGPRRIYSIPTEPGQAAPPPVSHATRTAGAQARAAAGALKRSASQVRSASLQARRGAGAGRSTSPLFRDRAIALRRLAGLGGVVRHAAPLADVVRQNAAALQSFLAAHPSQQWLKP